MRVSREQMSANRARILDEAARLFREHGFAAVTIADVMQAAGLTHGGFYGHFASKDALVAATITQAMSDDAGEPQDLDSFLDAYLAPGHRDTPAHGCTTAGLAGSMREQQPAAQAAMAAGMEAQLARIMRFMPENGAGDRRRAAIGRWSAMVGALILSRAVGDAALSDEILAETRRWLTHEPPVRPNGTIDPPPGRCGTA